MFAPAKDGLSPFGGLPIFTGPSEMMSATIHLAMTGGLVVAFPVTTISVYQLVSPLLSRKQRRVIVLFLPAIFVCYLGGTAFAYFVMLPVGFKFLLHFGEGIAVPLVNITEYMSLVTAMLFWLGVVFELPPAMFLLTKMRLVSYEQFRRIRRYVPAAAFILGALITPTFDIVNSTMVAIPIILLFEVGLFLSWLAAGRHKVLAQKVKAMVVWVLRRPVVAFKAAWRGIKRLGRRLMFWRARP